IINTHPALLPSFPGAHGVRDAIAHGVKVTGTTFHLVDAGVDTGPIIAQFPIAVRDEDDESSLHERIRALERTRLVELLSFLANGTLTIEGRRVTGWTPAS
ncbi:MAG TPA: formyltransferase family protein, partial [Brevibacterium sp.]|nr:formyltransferase family protein [Brevibacterium sp.]